MTFRRIVYKQLMKNTGKRKNKAFFVHFWPILPLSLGPTLYPFEVSINKMQASKTRKFALFQTSRGLTMPPPQKFPGGKFH